GAAAGSRRGATARPGRHPALTSPVRCWAAGPGRRPAAMDALARRDDATPAALDTAPRQWVAGLLGRADIRIVADDAGDDARPWDMRLHDPAALDRALAGGNLGLGEAYMAGAWDCERLDVFFEHLLRAHLDREVQPAQLAWHALQVKLFNRQNRRRAWQVGDRKSTRLNSSHVKISYAVFCLK